jgi:hypothetical protein
MTHIIRKDKRSFDDMELTDIYKQNQTEYGQTQINVRLEEDTVWLSTNQMA